ncbi:hypothetical protein D3C84_847760 [compost metagenome]
MIGAGEANGVGIQLTEALMTFKVFNIERQFTAGQGQCITVQHAAKRAFQGGGKIHAVAPSSVSSMTMPSSSSHARCRCSGRCFAARWLSNC